MSGEKFTPGPWPMQYTGDRKRIVIGKGLVEGPNGYEVAEVYSDDCPREIAEANAALIHAAPDLYEALRRLTADIDRRDLDKHYHADWKLAMAALAKARGEP